MKLMKRMIVLGCALLALTGCLETRFHTGRTVSLNLPAIAHETKISVTDPRVKEAIRLIDSALVSDGFTPDRNAPNGNEPDLIASYAKFDSAGFRQVGMPRVYLRGNKLDVVVVELGNRSGRSNAATKKSCELLRAELSRRFGSESVTITNAD